MTTRMMVPYDGNLETTGLIAHWAAEGREVIAACLDTGRVPALDPSVCERRVLALGASRAICVDLRGEVYESYTKTLIAASGPESAYSPVWRAAEDYALAVALLGLAREEKASLAVPPGRPRLARIVGATRGDVQLLTTDPREPVEWIALLEALGHEEQVPPQDEPLVDASIWGNVFSLDAEDCDDAEYPNVPPPWEASDLPEEFTVGFLEGFPSAAFGEELDGVNLFAQLTRVGIRHGIGRGGRLGVGVEAPATTILVAAHRYLERVWMDQRRLDLKDSLAATYRRLFADGDLHESVARDLEAFLASAQRGLSGTVRLELYRGNVRVLGP